MHMADALISPGVGAAMWAASAGMIGYCSKKVSRLLDDRRVPLMGVLGAFIFAAQMINFSIPGTGSSGHIGGGLLLAILLGPYASFLVISSVLVVQALFFADGGLLALGCNIFNMGFFPCFVAYPFIYRRIAGKESTTLRLCGASVLASVVGLQLGSLCVVLETQLSGMSELPFTTFALLMQPIHLAIGLVEGLLTAAVAIFVWKARPEVLDGVEMTEAPTGFSWGQVTALLLVASVLTGGVMSWFASGNPDGLEWAMFKTTGSEELQGAESGTHQQLARMQEKTAFLPGYTFPEGSHEGDASSADGWPVVDPETTVSGLVGGTITLLLAGLLGFVLKKRRVVA